MRIEEIIYDTTRGLLNLEDKLRIATVFLFCDKLGSEKLSELLYTENHEEFINNLNGQYSDYEVDFSINFGNKNVKDAFFKTLEKVIQKWDSNGFLKAVYEKDEFAMVIIDIVDYSFDKIELRLFSKEIKNQLEEIQLKFNFEQ